MRRDRDLLLLTAWLAAANTAAAIAAYWMWRHYELAHPELLWSLAVVPVLSAWFLLRRRKRYADVRLSTLSAFRHTRPDLRTLSRHLPQAAGLAGLALLLMGMAQPQSKDSWQDVTREGIDIVIAMDVSASMLAKDFEPDRLDAAKSVAMKFIDGRPNDRIGLVVFEGEAFTQCPLTTDHDVLKDLFMKARSGMIEGGTAVGMGLATAINRLRESTRKSRVIILMTDGVNNRGMIQPLDAARIAQQYGIRVYTIGVGSRGKALSPVAQGPNGQYQYAYVDVEIDDDMMKQVADLTGGTYFRATDEGKLKDVYEQIDKLEKTREKITRYSRHSDKYFKPLFAGCSLLVLGLLLDKTLFRTTP